VLAAHCAARTLTGGAASLEPRTAGNANSNSGRSLLRRPPEDQDLKLVLGCEIGRGHLEFGRRDFSHAVTAEADQGIRIALSTTTRNDLIGEAQLLAVVST
jgi:hypothetical protein